MIGQAHIIRGNALALPLADDSVDLVVTSPPYFALRSYQDGGEHYAGQLGSEATPTEFVDALIAATREMARVLKPSGSIWINLGDKYAERTGPPRPGYIDDDETVSRPANRPSRGRRGTIPVKSLMGIPWRYANRCVDDLGLILRAEVIWSKPNGLPESVTDRVRRNHEQWFHFTKMPRYFSAVDEIRERYDGDLAWSRRLKHPGEGKHEQRAAMLEENPLGKLPGSVWTIPTEPLQVPDHLGIDHFAAFPTEWPRRIIQGWSPPGVCTGCGEGRRPVAHIENVPHPDGSTNGAKYRDASSDLVRRRKGAPTISLATITGYACACPEPTAPTTPAVILDPFGGTGTTALVAKALDRTGISIDLSADYCRLAQWRTNDPQQMAKAARVRKPPVEVKGQLDLFEATS